jgi:predicted acyltransferase
LLLFYWGLMSLPGFELQPGQDLGAYIDRAIFGEAHLWRFTLTWDPEGLLSTLPAIVTGLCGTLTGYWLRSKHDGRIKLLGLLLFGCLGIVVGAAWGRIFPINKYLWTSSYAVYTAGFALIFMGACYWLFDLHQARVTWAQPFLWLGMNPLFAYVGAQIGVIALGTLYIGTVEQHIHLGTVIQKSLFGEHWDVIGQTAWRDPSWPMLYWTVLYTIFWTLSTGLLYRKSIFFKA